MTASPNQRMLTFTGGGWVLALTGLICLGLISWAVAPAIMRTINRPPGDGETIESYAFDLSNLTVPRELVSPAMLYRGMVPPLPNPSASGPDDSVEPAERWRAMQVKNDRRGKYIVASDLVIGVTINGESRAYPLHVMYVHDIVNDTLGGTPIAVTYNWLCDSAVVFDRQISGSRARIANFAVSGLVYNSNLLMFDTTERAPSTDANEVGGESLWSQLLAEPIAGEAVTRDESLTVLLYELTTWGDWSERHPNTTVIDRNVRIAARYKRAAPTEYFRSDELLHPVQPMPESDNPPPKTPVVAIAIGDDVRRAYPLPWLTDRARSNRGRWSDTVGDVTLQFIFDEKFHSVRVEHVATKPVRITHAYWFAVHAMDPRYEVAQSSAATTIAE